MAVQGQTMIAASGDAGSEDCYPTDGSTQLAVDDPGSQPDVVSAGGTSLPSASAASQSVWNDCQGTGLRLPGQRQPGVRRRGVLPRVARQSGPAHRVGERDQSLRARRRAGRCPTSPTRRTRRRAAWPPTSTDAGPAFGGTSVAAPSNAGLFADTNQGCFSPLGRVGPALYAAEQASSGNFTDITSGNNDFTNTNCGRFAAGAGFDAASGLGTPVDQNLALALQGADGCPSVAAVSPDTGPVSGAGAITIVGGGFANATSVTFGSAGAGRIVGRRPPPPSPSCRPRVPARSAWTSPSATRRASRRSRAADHYGFGGDLDCGDGYRFVASDGGVFDFGDAGF